MNLSNKKKNRIPRFSVIIPIYNVESFVEKCLNSLLIQDYSSVEFILVDDGSSDKSSEICDRYSKQDNRIKVVHKTNGGLVSARKAGCDEANGEYILNVDGDDWVEPGYFKKLDEIVEKYHPDCMCFGIKYVRDDVEEDCPIALAPGFYTRRDIERNIFPILIENAKGKYFSPSVCSKAIKRNIYVKCQMAVDDRIKIGEDQACTKPAIYRSEKIYILSDCLYCYRFNPLSMTKNRSVFSWQGPRLIGEHFEKMLPIQKYDFEEQIFRSVVHHLFNVVISQFYGKESFLVICKTIKNNLELPYYKNAIMKCKYRCIKGMIAYLSLKYRLFLCLFLWARIK